MDRPVHCSAAQQQTQYHVEGDIFVMQTHRLSLVMATVAFGLTILSGAATAASKYTVTFDRPAVVAGMELKPGDYHVTVEGAKVTISDGKQTTQADAEVRTEDRKFSSTTVRYDTGDGKFNVVQIRLGGTRTVLEFPSQAAAANRAQPDAQKSGGGSPRNSAR